jgi:hypothetical protein
MNKETETFFHVSEIYNRESILKRGIIPSKIIIDSHLEYFKEDNLLQDEENKIIYFWQDSENNEKFIKDMVYCKTFISPRNRLIKKDNKEIVDFSLLLKSNLYKYEKMVFDIYKINKIKECIENYRPFHGQFPEENIYNSLYGMDERYAHNNKILAFSKTPEKNVKIVGQAEFMFTKNKKYEVKIIK